MPFSGDVYLFTESVIDTINEVGAVYGLFNPSTRAGYFDCLYVGRTDNLRRRLNEHFNNPPINGVTHFLVEIHATERERIQRERHLIAEFNPSGNVVGRR